MNPETPRPAAVCIGALTHRYRDRPALEGVDLSVADGELFGLLGPNGSGKTTLFHILATLLMPTSGRVSVFGDDVLCAPHAVRRRLGIAFQTPSLDAKLTVCENLAHHGHMYGLHGRALRERIDRLLGRLGLADRRHDRAGTLSGGLRRRADLARAMLHGPRLLLLDEPSAGLDPAARRALWECLDELRRGDRVTILVTTHLMEEGDRCDRLALLDAGRLVAEGSPDELKARIGGDVVAVEADAPDSLAASLRDRFGVSAAVIGGEIEWRATDAERLVGRLFEAFPGRIRAVRIGRPTLGDVFHHYTGRRFRESGEPAEASAP